jgi:hypothetical protein
MNSGKQMAEAEVVTDDVNSEDPNVPWRYLLTANRRPAPEDCIEVEPLVELFGQPREISGK